MPPIQGNLLDLFLASTGVCTDTRKLEKGNLFFALKGENFNGNKFAASALEQGALAAIVDEKKYHLEEGTLLVEDVLTSLQDLARDYRRNLDCKVLALTGSNGKTTTKELIHAVLSTKYKVHATAGNFNNHIGVPLTLLSTPEDTEIIVVEMGANHVGEIKFLCEIAEPDYGLITNIGKAHLEGFGSIEGVITGKTEMYRHILKSGKLVFYNRQDDLLFSLLPAGIKAVSYRDDLEFSVSDLTLNFNFRDLEELYKSELTGTYNEPNVLAALSISRYFGINDKAAATAIATYTPKDNRSEISEVNGYDLILDAYNANPTSMHAAINSFHNLKTDKPKNLLLGDMKELGNESIELHKEIIDLISTQEWHSVTLVGADFKLAGRPFLKEGITLVKASRSLKLESIKDLLTRDS